jgi:carboxyl-terminal processing protease
MHDTNAYFENALEIIRSNALLSSSVDWLTVEADGRQKANSAQSRSEIYDAIRYVLNQLGDNHSFLSLPDDEQAVVTGERDAQNELPTGRALNAGINYLVLPAFLGSEKAAIAYADEVQRLIGTLDAQSTRGWIVDLTQNSGGNMWPMIAGVGPLLGEDTVGYFVDNLGKRMEWRYQSGQSFCDDRLVEECSREAHVPRRVYPIAVLIGAKTASSGEGVVAAFSGRDNTLLVGEATYGQSTGNQMHQLEDGAAIYLTEVVFADRTGKQFGGKIEPDVAVSEGLDKMIDVAMEWILERA